MAQRPNNRKRKKGSVSKHSKVPVGPTPKLTPAQISIIAGLLSNFFQVESVLYNRKNVIKVILTSNPVTTLPILGPSNSVNGNNNALIFLESGNNRDDDDDDDDEGY